MAVILYFSFVGFSTTGGTVELRSVMISLRVLSELAVAFV